MKPTPARETVRAEACQPRVSLKAAGVAERLATLLPPPRRHLLRFHGVFGPNARLRPLVTREGRPWVRVDWMDGGDLASLLARVSPLPVPLACRIGAEVALALHVLHSAKDDTGRPLGLVHRDVTASNVLLTRLGEVKLGDFGIAKATRLREQTRGGVRKGTASAMSPEQVAGRPLSPASDVFSLATLVTELLTGKRPFDGDSAVETMDRIREATRPDPSGLPGRLTEVLATAFALEPTARPDPLALRADQLPLASDELTVAYILQRQPPGHAG